LTGHNTIYNIQIEGIKHYFLQLEIKAAALVSVSYKPVTDDINLSSFLSFKNSHPANQKIIEQFNCFFKNPRINWDIKLAWPKRTDFQHQVLNYLTTIPVGSTMTYGQIAQALQTSARAVGNACRNNPYPIIIPCHRVVAKNSIGGYDGDRNKKSDDLSGRLEIKYFLLKHEKAINES
jgi:methylated-DNA-[protein]-cysteine S-methyltransferase